MRLLALCAALTAAPAAAHEVWIDPEAWQVGPGEEITAAVRNGQNFEGASLPWLPFRVARAEVMTGSGTSDILSRPGDRPALRAAAESEGLAVVLYCSDPIDLTYDSFAKFELFLEEKGNADLLDVHRDRGMPEEDVTEVYTRFAKSLVAIGDGEGSDSFRGMELELVAETNPFTAAMPGEMVFRLHYRESPLPDHRVTLFDKGPEGDVTLGEAETDQEGRVSFPAARGHTYLVDAVVVREPEVVGNGGEEAMWESLWASLTFAVPGS